MAVTRYITLSDITITSGSTTITINALDQDRLNIVPGDLLHVEGRNPIIIDSIESIDSSSPDTYDKITLRYPAEFTHTNGSCVIVSGQVRATEALQILEDNNTLFRDNFGLFLTWISSSSTTESLRDDTGNINSYTTPQGLQSSINQLYQKYTLPNTTNNILWVKLGTWDTSQSGKKLNIKIYSAYGYNAVSSQQSNAQITLNTSNWASNNSGFYISGMSTRTGNINGVRKFAVVQNTINSYDVYVNLGSYTGDGSFYTIELGHGTWSNDGSTTISDSSIANSLEIVPQDIHTQQSLAYETGTYTPIFEYRNSSSSYWSQINTWDFVEAKYTRTGDLVHVAVNLKYSVPATTIPSGKNYIRVTLPFVGSSSFTAHPQTVASSAISFYNNTQNSLSASSASSNISAGSNILNFNNISITGTQGDAFTISFSLTYFTN